MSLLDALNDLTVTVSTVFKHSDQPPPTCGANCGACCYEPVYATWAEATLIISTIRSLPNGEAGIKMVKLSVQHWIKAFEESDLHHQDRPKAIEYRRLFLACPFLTADQNCDVYAVRPGGCRMHFTNGDPSWCGNLEKRTEQSYVDVEGTALVIPPLLDAIMALAREAIAIDPEAEGDHLGVMLAEVLDLNPEPSGARTRKGE